MKKFTGETIHDAIHQALCEFSCSPNNLEYEVVLSSKKGFLGFGKQDAVILAQKKQSTSPSLEETFLQEIQETQNAHQESQVQDVHQESNEVSIQDSYSQIQDNFFQDKLSTQDIAKKIEQEIKELFSYLPYEISQVKVKAEKDEGIYVEFDGADCGLLIGERGYRYSAIFYLLSVWIKKEYGLNLRLEIADFLKNKEQKIEAYLEENYDKIISRPNFQTQTFDLLSASIALKRFREAIPDKYIVSKQIAENESIILISDFRSR